MLLVEGKRSRTLEIGFFANRLGGSLGLQQHVGVLARVFHHQPGLHDHATLDVKVRVASNSLAHGACLPVGIDFLLLLELLELQVLGVDDYRCPGYFGLSFGFICIESCTLEFGLLNKKFLSAGLA